MELALTVTGDTEIVRKLGGVADAATDLRPAWKILRLRFIEAERRAFARQGGRTKWAPLSAAYAAEKARRYPGKTILRATDDLFHSLTDRLSIDVRTETMMVLGSDSKVGKFHQTGTRRMPARPPIDLTVSEIRSWVQIVDDHLLGKWWTEAA